MSKGDMHYAVSLSAASALAGHGRAEVQTHVKCTDGINQEKIAHQKFINAIVPEKSTDDSDDEAEKETAVEPKKMIEPKNVCHETIEIADSQYLTQVDVNVLKKFKKQSISK